MNDLFGHLEFVKVFLDDLLIHSTDESEHSKHMIQILEVIEEQNISINFEKSVFFQEEVRYLGHVIDKDRIKADIKKLYSIPERMSTPKTIKELRSVLGVINWFRPYIYNLSSRISSVTDKTKKNALKNWSEKDTERINEKTRN
jgi:hypothetical protein